ncbi:GntR family transcriptional regulator [Microbacterium sp. NPDC089320]|uniref:GntR family transcriptional regulator n=1 Tax=Microbacterium sp. NPDC089320 TaxID=3155182 RepID=UPI0034168845
MTIVFTESRARQWIHHGSVPLPELAFRHILAAILRGEYRSGDMLNTMRFAEELDMSLNPIREAIIRLRDIGLVEVVPARYTRVADLTTPDSRAAIRYAGVLAGTGLRSSLPTAADGVRADLAAYAEEIGGAVSAVHRDAAAIAFLTAVADVMHHPRQSTHLVEATILAQCALQFSESPSGGDATPVLSATAEAVAHALRDGAPDAVEETVRALFEHLA